MHRIVHVLVCDKTSSAWINVYQKHQDAARKWRKSAVESGGDAGGCSKCVRQHRDHQLRKASDVLEHGATAKGSCQCSPTPKHTASALDF